MGPRKQLHGLHVLAPRQGGNRKPSFTCQVILKTCAFLEHATVDVSDSLFFPSILLTFLKIELKKATKETTANISENTC
jgi:hypothetical protein